MKIDKKLILKLEKLSRLELSEKEREQIQKDLNNILKMVEKLEELDTDDVEPLLHVSDGENVLRQDEIKNQLSKEEALSNSPDSDGDYFKVPKVIS
jgi:aspartyl-tRNA(Asn)/glutamyl-tRNA(Gln) amidotransferase subunit C